MGHIKTGLHLNCRFSAAVSAPALGAPFKRRHSWRCDHFASGLSGERNAEMVLQFLTLNELAACKPSLGIENDEPRHAVGKLSAGDDQRMLGHGLARTGDTVGEQEKRIGSIKILADQPPRAVSMSGKRFREICPGVADRTGMPFQRGADIRLDAIDVDVELVLRATQRRIDREAQRVARQRLARRFANVAARAPSGGKIIRRVDAKQRGTFNPGDAGRWDEEKLGSAIVVLVDGVAALRAVVQMDQHARPRIGVALYVRDAFVMDNVPQPLGIDGRNDTQSSKKRESRRCGQYDVTRAVRHWREIPHRKFHFNHTPPIGRGAAAMLLIGGPDRAVAVALSSVQGSSCQAVFTKSNFFRRIVSGRYPAEVALQSQTTV